MSNEVAFNSLDKDDVKITFEEPSRVRSKPTDEEIAAHRKTRLVLVVLFGIVVLALVVVAIIIIVVAPRCEPKKDAGDSGKSNDTLKANETADDPGWWKHAAIYQVYPRSFYDQSGDGNGDLNGISSKLDHFVELGVDALWLNPIYESPDGDYFSVENYIAIDKKFGTMEDFNKLVEEAHKKGLKVILDFIPNHTSEKHPWFVASKANTTNSKRDWYIWRDGIKVNDNKTDPPNNWLSVFGGSAWEYDNTTKQYYLHQFKKQQPDLNLRNKDVINELKKALTFWLGKGVDGFRLDSVQYYLEDDKFQDEPKLPGYNESDPQYDKLDHKYTFNLDEDLDILKIFRDVLKNGSHLVMAGLRGDGATTTRFYQQSDIPKNYALVSNLNLTGMSLAQAIGKTVTDYLDAVKDHTPNWAIGDHDAVRVGSRDGVGKDNRNTMNALLLTLPGVVTCYYGEEIGMLNGNIAKPADPRDNELTPMQWNDEAHAGFSTVNPWLPVAPEYKTLNVKTEKADAKSFYNNYIKLVKLRKDPAFASDVFKIVHVDKDVVSYTRGPDDNQFHVSLNFGDTIWMGDFAKLSGRGVVVFDSESDAPGNNTVDVNRMKLNPGQVVIVSRGDEIWHEK